MKIKSFRLTPRAESDLKYWAKTDPKIYAKIKRLIESAMENPATGIGKPERLLFELTGYWSRRITRQDRLVYTVVGNELLIIQARFHYE